MAVSNGFSSATALAKVAVVLIGIGNICNYIAFCTTSWGIAHAAGDDDYHTGLWRRCRLKTKGCNYLDGYAKVWFGVVQGFACIGFGGLNLTFILIICYLFLSRCHRDREVSLAAGFVGVTTAVCWFIAVVVFGVEYEDDDDVSATVSPYGDELGYSFVLAVFTLVFEAVAGGLMLVECFYKREQYYREKRGRPFQTY